MLKAFLEFSMLFRRLGVKPGEVEIVICCRSSRVEDLIMADTREQMEAAGEMRDGRLSKKALGAGELMGIPFRIEAGH